MYGKPEHRPRITDYQYVMALVQSGGLAVYGRFLHCPLFRAICGAWNKGRPPPEVPSWAALRRPRGGFHRLYLGHPPACAPALARMLLPMLAAVMNNTFFGDGQAKGGLG